MMKSNRIRRPSNRVRRPQRVRLEIFQIIFETYIGLYSVPIFREGPRGLKMGHPDQGRRSGVAKGSDRYPNISQIVGFATPIDSNFVQFKRKFLKRCQNDELFTVSWISCYPNNFHDLRPWSGHEGAFLVILKLNVNVLLRAYVFWWT